MFTYQFQFDNGELLEFPVPPDRLYEESQQDNGDAAFWVRLDYCQCPNCPLKSQEVTYCPAARNLQGAFDRFRRVLSYERATVIVTGTDREYRKRCDVQTGLRSLYGLIMASSSCPILSQFRMLARFHLPFASMHETMFRSIAFYMVKQLMAAKRGKEADLTLKGLSEFYSQVDKVNHAFSERIREAADADANLNAIVKLSALSSIGTYRLDEFLEEIDQFDRYSNSHVSDANATNSNPD